MGIHWHYLNADDQSLWSQQVSKKNLSSFTEVIVLLEETNRKLKKVSTFFSEGGLGGWLAMLDRTRFRHRVRKAIKSHEQYVEHLRNTYRLPWGHRDHMSWHDYPKEKEFHDLLRRAHDALRD